MVCLTEDTIPKQRTAQAEHSYMKGQGSRNGKLFWVVGGDGKNEGDYSSYEKILEPSDQALDSDPTA